MDSESIIVDTHFPSSDPIQSHMVKFNKENTSTSEISSKDPIHFVANSKLFKKTTTFFSRQRNSSSSEKESKKLSKAVNSLLWEQQPLTTTYLACYEKFISK